ncbi:putative ORF1 [Torque teno didelphis albiventris virus]|uniref:Capsid protein n=1 Tax=Torque teno didelphis albiventris virus TaxID=2054619 RepID=A0A2H4QBD9_9VIRU|nr:putative ORF1 [Torque teno didelphis albiventris virus]ATX61858.1 putative ORF1 [Torque teno didelphis albiventris virus]
MPFYYNSTFGRKYAYFRRQRWLRRYGRRPARRIRRRYTRRKQVRRRRRRGPRKQTITQWGPGRRLKCNIVGFWSAIVGIQANTTVQYTSRNLYNYGGGGIQTWKWSLLDMYYQHKDHMCYWSASNDGTDLARYHGTTLYCFPNDSFSYIVHWDRDLYKKDVKNYPIYLSHPYLLLLHPDHKVVWSLKHKGRAKAKRIVLRPPAQLTNEWYFQADLAPLNLWTVQFTLFDPDNVWLQASDGSIKMTVGVDSTLIGMGTTGRLWQTMYATLWDIGCEDNLVAVNRTKQPPATATSHLASPEEYHADMNWEYFGAGYPYWITLWGTDLSKSANSPSEIKTGKNVWIKWFPPKEMTKPSQVIEPDFTKKKLWTLLTRTQAQALVKSGWFIQKSDPYSYNIFVKYRSRFEWGGYTPDVTDTVIDPIPNQPAGTQQPLVARTSRRLQQVQVQDPSKVGQDILNPWDLRRGIITKRAFERITADPEQISFTAIRPSTGKEKELSHSEDEASSEEAESSWEEDPGLSTSPDTRKLYRLVKHLRKQLRD